MSERDPRWSVKRIFSDSSFIIRRSFPRTSIIRPVRVPTPAVRSRRSSFFRKRVFAAPASNFHLPSHVIIYILLYTRIYYMLCIADFIGFWKLPPPARTLLSRHPFLVVRKVQFCLKTDRILYNLYIIQYMYTNWPLISCTQTTLCE